MKDVNEMTHAEVMAVAQETVNSVIEQMPVGLTPGEERAYLLNTSRALGKACMVIAQMIKDKPAEAIRH